MTPGPTPHLYALHKPRGVVSSTVPEGGAVPVTDLLPAAWKGSFAVGRLDRDSEGLLLFSDDARLSQRLMDPGRLAKTYLVTVEGNPDEASFAPMREGGFLVGRRWSRRPCVCRRSPGRAPRA